MFIDLMDAVVDVADVFIFFGDIVVDLRTSHAGEATIIVGWTKALATFSLFPRRIGGVHRPCVGVCEVALICHG